MTECIESQIPFSFYPPRRLTADFSGGQITSDVGLLALRQFDHRRRLTASLVRALTDPRCSKKVDHPLASLLRQRLYQIVAGYEDANDADRLSCHRYLANAFRLLLHGFAYNLVNLFRLRLPPALRSAQIETLRNRVFKLGARIRQTARRVWVHLASGWPFQSLFVHLCRSLDTS